jgi:hypothetical protein
MTTYSLVMAGFLVLAGVGVISLRLHWAHQRPFGRYCHHAFVGIIVFAVIGLISSTSKIIWDGGFPQSEFEITFQHPDGKPLKGIELRVEDRQGRVFYRYPVSDFAPNQIPTSGEDGVMIFHHVGDGVEFGGRDWYLFGFIPIREGPPVYVCCFLYEGREVYRIEYDKLRRPERGRELTARVKRQWKAPEWPLSEFAERPGDAWDDADKRVRTSFHMTTDGTFNREAAIAYHTVMRDVERQGDAPTNAKEFVEEIEFAVIRLTIWIP